MKFFRHTSDVSTAGPVGERRVGEMIRKLQALGRWRRFGFPIVAVLAQAVIWFGFPRLFVWLDPHGFDAHVRVAQIGCSIAFALMVLMGAMAALPMWWPPYRRIARQLAQERDLAAAGVLIDSLQYLPQKRVRIGVMEALADILPRVRDRLNCGLTDQRMKMLLAVLKHPRYYSHSYVIGVLQACERFGDGRFLFAVEHLTESSDQAISIAAQRCLEAIQERETLREVAGNLLRPTSPGEDAVLLRATETKGSNDGLLRPVATEEGDTCVPECDIEQPQDLRAIITTEK